MKKNLFITILSVAVIGLVFLMFGLNRKSNPLPFTAGGAITTTYTNSVSYLATASSEVLAKNHARQYVKCVNTAASSTDHRMHITFGATASQNWGIPLYASNSFEVTQNNLGDIYIGAITGAMVSEVGSTSANYGRINCIEQ